jgi:hypothetical protein
MPHEFDDEEDVATHTALAPAAAPMRELIVDETPPYGPLPPAGVVGGQGFLEHDGTQTWSDGGAVEHALKRVANELVCEQVKMAIYEYVTQQRCFSTLVQGRAAFVVDSSNAAVDFATFWRYDLSLFAAIAQALQAGDAQMLQAIGNMLGDVVERLPAEYRPPSFRHQPGGPVQTSTVRGPGGRAQPVREGAIAGDAKSVRAPAGGKARPGSAPGPGQSRSGRLGGLQR